MINPIVFVGVAAYDAISVVPRHPERDERLVASDVVFAGGGPAATAAVAARRLGAPVRLIAPVGQDRVADLIADDLNRFGIDPSHLQIESGRSSQASAVVCAADDATRAITTLSAAPLHLSAASTALVRDADWVHVDHLGWPAVEEALAGVPTGERPQISVDAGHPLIGEARCDPDRVALYVPPLEKLITDETLQATLEEPVIAAALRAVRSERVVATRGGAGATGRDTDGTVTSVPGYRIAELASTLGAGDVFHGALVAAVAAGESLPQGIRLANAVAALACRGVDGRSAIPGREEAESFINRQSA